MKRFTGHQEPWGEFVDVKVNATSLLKNQLKKAKPGVVAISTVTDPYQSLEKGYKITRGCLEALLDRQFPVNLLTRSPLCLRDLDLFKRFEKIKVGLTVTTHDERIKKLFEPCSPSISARINALETLHKAGIRTYAFIGPLLPLKAAMLARMLEGVVDEVLIDRMNYPNKVKGLYRKNGLDTYLTDDYFNVTGLDLKERFEKKGIPVSLIF
jgi:DNA repair photolyase